MGFGHDWVREELFTAAHSEALGGARHEHTHGRVGDAERVRDLFVGHAERSVDDDLPFAIGEIAEVSRFGLVLAGDDVATAALFEAVDERPTRVVEWTPQELFPIIPPRLQYSCVEGSGPKVRL